MSFPHPTPVLEETVLRGAPFGRNIVRAPMGLWVLAEAGKDPSDHSFCPLATPAGRRTRCTTRTETRSRTSTTQSRRAWEALPPRCAMPTRSTTPRRKGTAAQPGTGREKGAGDGPSSRCFFIKALQSLFSRAGPYESERKLGAGRFVWTGGPHGDQKVCGPRSGSECAPRPGFTPEVQGGQDELWFLALTGTSQELFPSAFRSAG